MKFLKYLIYQIKLLPYRPRLWWNWGYIPENEFDGSLFIDMNAVLKMNKRDQDKYLQNLIWRRTVAHRSYLCIDCFRLKCGEEEDRRCPICLEKYLCQLSKEDILLKLANATVRERKIIQKLLTGELKFLPTEKKNFVNFMKLFILLKRRFYGHFV
jgi:hypothetical protein